MFGKKKNSKSVQQNTQNLPKTEKIIKTKQSWEWNYICVYLQAIKDFNVVQEDEEFCDLFQQLYDCAYEKIALHDDGDITDIYVVVDQIETGVDTEKFAERRRMEKAHRASKISEE